MLVCLPLVIHDVSPRPFSLPNIIIFSIRQYVKNFLRDEDFQYVGVGWAGRLLCGLWFVGGFGRAANGPECEGMAMVMGSFLGKCVNVFKK